MFFFLSKVLLFFISPFFWLIISGFACFYFRNRSWRKYAIILTSFIFIFFSNSFLFLTAASFWEVEGVKLKDVKHHDVAVILGGMSGYNNDLERLSFGQEADRLMQGISLYHGSKVSKILISGDSGYLTDHGLHEAKQIKELLLDWGIPEEDILTEEISKNTHENAIETKKTIEKHPEIKSILLVTSGIHMKRALACFKKQKLECTPYSTDIFTNKTKNYYWDQYLIPNQTNFIHWNKLIKEIVGYYTYAIMGYI